MEPKKISFGFMKTKKAVIPVVEERRDYIEWVEEKAIKVVGGETIIEKPALVIPMKPNTLVTAERLREIAEKVEKDVTEELQPQITTVPDNFPLENETLDQMAVRELLEDAKKDEKVEISELTVPIPAKVVLEGEKESSLEDYESVPIQDFGMAMLRGMGWTPGKDGSKYKLPELRPKGLGLGADKVVKDNQKKNASKDKTDEELTIVKNAFVKVVTGKYSGYYGKAVSLDEDNGRVMVDIPIKKETISLSEFMLQPVTKAEFDKESRVINQDTYEEYKKKEKRPNSSRHESPNTDTNLPTSSTKSNDLRDRNERNEDNRDKRSSNGNRDRKRRDSSSEERYHRKTKRNGSKERCNRKTKRDDSVEKKREQSGDRMRKRRDSSSKESDYRKMKRDDSVEKDRRKKNRDKSEERLRKRRDSSSEEIDYKKTKRDDSVEKRRRKKNRDKSKERSKTRKKSRSPDKGSSKRKDKNNKYSSNESLDSLSDDKKGNNKSKSRKNSQSDTESDDYNKTKRRSKTPEGKRDIDKKRKGKKKKRDRDRSPNHKKHRK